MQHPFLKRERIRFFIAWLLMLLCVPVTARADMVWPSLYIAKGMMSIYIIITGFVVEVIFIKLFLKQGWFKSVIISAVMNAVSTAAGIVLIPVSGILTEFILLASYSFGFFHWLLDYIFVILLNTLIEGLIVKFVFRFSFKKIFWWLLAANAISVVLCSIFAVEY